MWQQFWIREEPYRFVSVQEIAAAFEQSKAGRERSAALAVPFPPTAHSRAAVVHKRYALSGGLLDMYPVLRTLQIPAAFFRASSYCSLRHKQSR